MIFWLPITGDPAFIGGYSAQEPQSGKPTKLWSMGSLASRYSIVSIVWSQTYHGIHGGATFVRFRWSFSWLTLADPTMRMGGLGSTSGASTSAGMSTGNTNTESD